MLNEGYSVTKQCLVCNDRDFEINAVLDWKPVWSGLC